MEIIDAYTMAVGDLKPWTSQHVNLMRKKKGTIAGENLNDITVGSLRESMLENGISRTITILESIESLSSDWCALESHYEQHKDFFTLVPSIGETDFHNLGVISDLKQQGLNAVHFRPAKWTEPRRLNDPSLFPVYQAVSDAQLPLFVMCGGITGPDISYSDPAAVDAVANMFPDLRIVMNHGGWPYVIEACAVLHRRDNVWCMPDSYFPGFPGSSDYLQALRTFGQDRFIFSSIFPYNRFEDAIQDYKDLGLPDNVLRKVFAGNVKSLFDFATDTKSPVSTELSKNR